MTTMSQTTSFLSRVGQWFRPGRSDGRLPLESQVLAHVDQVKARRVSFWRPWARRDAAIASLQQGFTSLSELMNSIRDNLEKQGQRQDQMLSYLSHLPEILHSLPEAQRVQGQTLQAIGQQLANQVQQQIRLNEILAKLSDAGADQRALLEALHGRVEQLDQHDLAIVQNLRQVGAAMDSMGRSSESSTQVLQQMRDNLAQRDIEVQRVLQRQNTRFTILVVCAIVLSVAALAAVGVMGYLLVHKMA